MDSPTHIAWAKRQLGRGESILADSAVCEPDLAALGLPDGARYGTRWTTEPETLGQALGARLGAPDGRVLIVAGASEANAVAFGALLAPGDEVLVEVPGYEPHRLTPARFGARVRAFRRPLDGAPGAVAAAVEQALGPATRLVVLTHLHNPSGAPLDDADLAALDQLADARDLRLLIDETFRDADPAQPIGTVAARGPRWIATGTFTKCYGLGGLRIGWVACDPGRLAACRAMHELLSSVPASLSVSLATALLPHLGALRARTHAILAANRAAWEAFLARQATLRAPAASRGTTAWALVGDSARWPDAGDAFADHVRERFGLLVVPGRFMGDPAGVRVTLGGEPAAFAKALAVLEQAEAAWAAARARSIGAVPGAAPREAR